MLRRLSRLPLFAVLVLRVALADSIPPRELGREIGLSSANRSVPSLLQAVSSHTNTRGLAGDIFNGFSRHALRFNGRQEDRLRTPMIFVPLGDGQAYRLQGSRVAPSKSFADHLLEVLFVRKKGREKSK
jgi:hypothetical protein